MKAFRSYLGEAFVLVAFLVSLCVLVVLADAVMNGAAP